MNETKSLSASNLSANISLFSHKSINGNVSNVSWYDSGNNLGYGIGKLLRGAFDQTYNVWQNWWNPKPSQQEGVIQRQISIYKKGLKECIPHFEGAIENLRRNPKDRQNLEKIKKLAAHYEQYVKAAPTEELSFYQRKLFQAIEKKVEKFEDKLKEALIKFLPVLHLEDNAPVFAKNKRAIQQQFPASFDLNSLDGTNGFMIPGAASGDKLGVSVSTAGDINGDNIMDLVLGADNANSGNGAAYVIFGSRGGFTSPFNLTALNGTNGFTISGVLSGGLGVSVSTAGDINGDNITDLVLGAYNANSANGAAYVIFGSRGGFTSPFNLTTLNGTNGFTIPSVTSGGELGWSVSKAGDINGDNIPDLVLGADLANSPNGAAYVIFGNRTGFTSSFNLNTLNGINGFTIPGGASGSYIGWSISTAGDINGDNITDLVLGTYNAGNAYVIFGSQGRFASPFNLNSLNGTNGFTIPGVISNSYLGYSVRTAGDINGDNITDLVLGAPYANSNNGVAYVIFGNRGGFTSSFNLNTLNGNNGFTIPGVVAGSYLGSSVSTAGDINGDNITDLVLGAYNANSPNGAAYVIFGSRAGFTSIFNLTTLNGTNGFTIPGAASGGFLGVAVSTAGDINGDNITDLVLGADKTNGTAYVIFGQNSPAVAPTPVSTLFNPCPLNQPLTLHTNPIQINKGQNLRLTPNDLSASCGNNTLPNLGTAFTITAITHSQFKTRNASNLWNNASSFWGSDLANGNVELIQDNTSIAPEFNFTVTDGQTTLPDTAANIQFNITNSVPQITSIALDIQFNGTTVLNPQEFQISDNSTNLANLVISIESVQSGYFSTVQDPSQPLTDFTYYQVQAGQIQFVHNGTALPNITLGVDNGLGSPVAYSPLVNFFNLNNSGAKPFPIGVTVGVTAGVVASAAIAGILFYKYKFRPEQKSKMERYEAHAKRKDNLQKVSSPTPGNSS